ncbi:hypothetical protein HQ545_00525 [Candidatus Woesearchaeota archaeon]|nr:hypothetical protein [Candidatus Woesearchaeota archaeon]
MAVAQEMYDDMDVWDETPTQEEISIHDLSGCASLVLEGLKGRSLVSVLDELEENGLDIGSGDNYALRTYTARGDICGTKIALGIQMLPSMCIEGRAHQQRISVYGVMKTGEIAVGYKSAWDLY